MDAPITLKHNTSLESAHQLDYAGLDKSPVDTYDDGLGPLWLFGYEYGVCRVIRAMSFQDAWEIAIDESPTVAADEVHEAYGFYGDERRHEDTGETWGDACKRANETENWPELIEGYEYQSNSSGTGVVDVGHYAWLREATMRDFQSPDSSLRIVVTAD